MEYIDDEKFKETEEFVWLYDIFGCSEEKKYCKHCGSTDYEYTGAFKKTSRLKAMECFIEESPNFKGKGRLQLRKYHKEKDGWMKSTTSYSQVFEFTTIECLKEIVIQIARDLAECA